MDSQQELEKLRQRVAELEVTEAKYKTLSQYPQYTLLQTIFDKLREGCQLIGFDWRYLYVNDAVVQQSRYTREQLLGRTMMEAYPGIENTKMYSVLKKCMADRNPYRFENEFTFPDGSKGWFDLSIQPMPEGIFILSIERTEQKRFEEYTNQHYRLASLGQFAAGIAHDFNNILTSIIGTAQMLELSSDMTEPLQEDVKIIFSQAQRAGQLIKQILDFSRKTTAEMQPVNFTDFLSESVSILKRMLPENIEIATQLPQNTYINADQSQLQQIINNLAVNARDAMPEGGKIEIQVSAINLSTSDEPPLPQMPTGDWVVWKFADTGQGIAKEKITHIFEPFFTTKPKEQGTGLGLAQVYGIVGQHNGFIDVQSELDQGTVFTIYLPANTPPQQTNTNNHSPIQRGNGQTILVVEDDDLVLGVMQKMLTKLNYKIISASNGTTGLEMYKAHQQDISLVITDMVMPHLGGKALIESLLSQNPNLPILVMSGYSSELDKPNSIIHQVNEVLAKPISIDKLSQAIYKALT